MSTVDNLKARHLIYPDAVYLYTDAESKMRNTVDYFRNVQQTYQKATIFLIICKKYSEMTKWKAYIKQHLTNNVFVGANALKYQKKLEADHEDPADIPAQSDDVSENCIVYICNFDRDVMRLNTNAVIFIDCLDDADLNRACEYNWLSMTYRYVIMCPDNETAVDRIRENGLCENSIVR